MKFGIPISFLLHAIMLSGGVFLFRTPPPLEAERLIIPIDIIDVAERTNIKAAVKRPKPEPDPKPEPEILTTEEPEPEIAPPEVTPEALPQPESLAVKPDEDAPKDDAQKEEVKAAPAFNLDDLSALIDRSRDSQPEANQQKLLQSEETLYAFADVARRSAGEGDGLALSEIDALRAAMYKCWRIPADAKDPESLIIPVNVKLYRDGYVASVTLKNAAFIAGSSNPYMKIAADNALRAVSKCAPYDFLPQERYDDWKEMNLTFRPVLSQ